MQNRKIFPIAAVALRGLFSIYPVGPSQGVSDHIEIQDIAPDIRGFAAILVVVPSGREG